MYIFERRKRKPKFSVKIMNGIQFRTFRRRKIIRRIFFFSLSASKLFNRLSSVINRRIRSKIFLNPCIIIRADESVQIALTFCISWCKYFNEFHVSICRASAIGTFRWICELRPFQMQSVRSFRRNSGIFA